jgi:uncharacterized protein YuzE
MMREVSVTIRYDPDADAASLRLDPRQQVVRQSSFVRPRDLPSTSGLDPDDHSADLRLKFDADGRLHSIEFLMPREQFPPAVLDALGLGA